VEWTRVYGTLDEFNNEAQGSIRREMRQQKGRFGAVPYIGNKLFSSFAKKKIEKKNSISRKKILFLQKKM